MTKRRERPKKSPAPKRRHTRAAKQELATVQADSTDTVQTYSQAGPVEGELITERPAPKKPAQDTQPTRKQALFVHEYLKDNSSAAEAAIRAGYSRVGASSSAARLLQHPKIKAMIDREMATRSHVAQIDAVKVLKLLDRMVEADLSDIMDDNGVYLPLKEWPQIWRMMVEAVQIEETVTQDAEGKKQTIGRIQSVKFVSRSKALEMLGKHVDVSAFKDNLTPDTVGSNELVDLINKGRGRLGREPISPLSENSS